MLRVTRGNRNSNLQFTMTHAWSPYVTSIRLDFHEECIKCKKAIRSRAFLPSVTGNLIPCVLIFYRVNLCKAPWLGEERFDPL